MREIKAKRRTTPTFIYNISDTQASGFDLRELKIGMTIVIEAGNKELEPTIHILGSNDGLDIFALPAEENVAGGLRLFVNPSYCRYIENSNSFHITIPLWKLSSEVKANGVFQVYLYGEKRISGAGGKATVGEADVAIIETVALHNIVIDEGTFILETSYVPEIEGQAKRDELNKVYI